MIDAAGRFQPAVAPPPGPLLPATPLDVLRFLLARTRHGDRVALVTITGVTGSSSRPVGTLMGIAADGSYSGSFSGGCIEAAVVAEGLAAVAERRPRQVRYGAGSPYIDIRLPCGGGVDLLFQPDPGEAMLEQAVSLLEQRRGLLLVQDIAGEMRCADVATPNWTGWRGRRFASWHAPPLRILVVGQGAECVSLVQLGLAFGAEAVLLSPDEHAVTLVTSLGARAARLRTPAASDQLQSDPWAAIVFLFHDHDWEPSLIEQALALPSLFVGAMGSRSTHQNRLAQLRARGVAEADCARIASPLGLVPSARDPATLAVSALAQIVDRYRLAVT